MWWIIFFILDLGLLALVIWLYARFRKWDAKRRARYDEEYLQETEKFYAVVRRILGEKAVEYLRTDYYWQGMPECFRRVYWGAYDHIKVIEKPGEVTRIYYYNPIAGARANARKKYHYEYHFRNRELVYWEIVK